MRERETRAQLKSSEHAHEVLGVARLRPLMGCHYKWALFLCSGQKDFSTAKGEDEGSKCCGWIKNRRGGKLSMRPFRYLARYGCQMRLKWPLTPKNMQLVVACLLLSPPLRAVPSIAYTPTSPEATS
jgi:hypothetical protein